MAEVICDTSALQYLHQLGELRILPELAGSIIVPPAVVAELDEGLALGVNLPIVDDLDWVTVRSPRGSDSVPLITDLGPGETQVLMLALESPGAIVVLDDARARRVAVLRSIPLTGTLGLLLNAKRVGLIAQIRPCLDRLHSLGFRLAARTRAAVLRLAGETE